MAKWNEQDLYRLAAWGYGCYQQGDLRRARIIFSAVVEARPTDSYAARGLAGIALLEGKPDEAVQLMVRVLQAKPNDMAARARLVESLIANARLAEASEGISSLYGHIPDEEIRRLELRLRHATTPQATSPPRIAITRS